MNSTLKKSLTIVVVAAGVLMLATGAHAQTSEQTPVQTLIQRIAAQFGLAQQDVQQVFVDHRAQMMGKKKQAYEAFLNTAVKNGKITETQKKLLLDKHTELFAKKQAEMEKWIEMTPQQRVDAKKQMRTELEAWAKTHNIDLSFLWGIGGPHMGMKGMHGINGGRFMR